MCRWNISLYPDTTVALQQVRRRVDLVCMAWERRQENTPNKQSLQVTCSIWQLLPFISQFWQPAQQGGGLTPGCHAGAQ